MKRSFDLCLCVLMCVVLGWLKYSEVKTVKSIDKIVEHVNCSFVAKLPGTCH